MILSSTLMFNLTYSPRWLLKENLQKMSCSGLPAPWSWDRSEAGTAGQISAIWSLQVVGSILGPPLADLVGRRVCCLLAAMASAASWLLLSSATSGNEATWPCLAARSRIVWPLQGGFCWWPGPWLAWLTVCLDLWAWSTSVRWQPLNSGQKRLLSSNLKGPLLLRDHGSLLLREQGVFAPQGSPQDGKGLTNKL